MKRAAYDGHVDAVSVLLNAGADVNHEDMSGATKKISIDNFAANALAFAWARYGMRYMLSTAVCLNLSTSKLSIRISLKIRVCGVGEARFSEP